MDGFIGEIRAFAFGYNPPQWVPCDGQQLNVLQYQLLYAIIGTRYGGNGNPYFNVPNLQGRALVSAGQRPGYANYELATPMGKEKVALASNNLTPHAHTSNGVIGSNATLSVADDGTSYLSNFAYVPDGGTRALAYGYVDPLRNPVQLNPNSVLPAGGNAQGLADVHENKSPYLAITYCICVEGEYPTHP